MAMPSFTERMRVDNNEDMIVTVYVVIVAE
jgi:hypothetical protein